MSGTCRCGGAGLRTGVHRPYGYDRGQADQGADDVLSRRGRARLRGGLFEAGRLLLFQRAACGLTGVRLRGGLFFFRDHRLPESDPARPPLSPFLLRDGAQEESIMVHEFTTALSVPPARRSWRTMGRRERMCSCASRLSTTPARRCTGSAPCSLAARLCS